MRIAIDATYSLDSQPSGVGSYCSNLISALVQMTPKNQFDLAYRGRHFVRALGSPLPGPNCTRRLLEEFNCYLFRGCINLFHGLNQRLPKCSFECTVSTFHDLFVMKGSYSTSEFRTRFSSFARDAASRSDYIIAISQYTAGQVKTLLQFDPSRIHVVHHGVNPVPQLPEESLDAFRRASGLQEPFLLSVGGIQERKNTARIIEVFERMPLHYRLVLAGLTGYGAKEIMERIEKSSARNRIWLTGYVDNSVLAKLYRTAEILLFPSLEEGFGFPIIEAMSAGLPVITSNCSAMPEVAGRAARLVNPEDVDSIEAGVIHVLEDQVTRKMLVSKGLERASQFTWAKAAEATLRVYTHAVEARQ